MELEAITSGKSGHIGLRPYRGDPTVTEMYYDDVRECVDSYQIPDEWAIVDRAALVTHNAAYAKLVCENEELNKLVRRIEKWCEADRTQISASLDEVNVEA